MNKRNTIYGFVLVSMVFILGAASLISNLTPLFDKIDKQMTEGETIVMNGKLNASKLEALLVAGDYVPDPDDAHFISEFYKRKIEAGGTLENLGAINGKRFRITSDSIRLFGGEGLKARLANDSIALGQDDEYASLDVSKISTVFGKESANTACISAMVVSSESYGLKTEPIAGIPVRLTEYWINDSIPSSNLKVSHESKTIAFAKTDKNGVAKFYVPKNKFYSVLPISKGYQYGVEKGTSNGALTADLPVLKFVQETHTLRPFSGGVYQQLKSNYALISRSPADFKNGVATGCAVFIISWLITFLVVYYRDNKQGCVTDTLLLLVLMILSGMGLLTLFGQMRPLTDLFNAYRMAFFIAGGCGLMLLLSWFNYLRLFQRYRTFWRGSRGFGQSAFVAAAPGYPFLILAILMMMVLFFIGKGPEGSDARVNIHLPGFQFQPSEVVKYLIVIFLAFFFIAEGDVIKTFGQKLTRLARRRQWMIVGVVLMAIALVCLIFLALLKDMGPGIVILATFILLYSVVRRDTSQLALGILTYIVLVGGTYILTTLPALRLITVSAWFVGWIIYGRTRKNKVVYESAIFFNALISMFLVGGYLIQPFMPHMVDRLFNRTGMTWSGIFDNAVPQGDQIAQGLWGIAGGGLTGMGLGGGSSYFIPAGHTDLILCSLGEQMGWLGILLVALCMFILITRTTKAAQYSGHKFTMYLCLGLGLLMGVQFLFISLGCVGALPLSGVPVPFMSYSGTSIIMALGAYGIVLSISRHRGSEEALKAFIVSSRRERTDHNSIEAISLSNNLYRCMILVFLGIVCFAGLNGYYQILANNKTMLRPAITSTDKGLRVMDYNPRIKQVIAKLDRGNIYDRNGILLATSNKDALNGFREIEDSLDIKLPNLDAIKGKRLKRYYPFGNHAVFMVGDMNRSDVYVDGIIPIGYLAENRHAETLQGYETHPETIELDGSNYKFHKFLDPVEDVEFRFTKRDYSALLPALKQPIHNNKWIRDFNKQRNKRDLKLTLDATLQTRLQENIASYIKNDPKLAGLKDLRASIVILDANQGDLLTSSNYPLPVTDSIVNLRLLNLDKKGGAPSEWRRGGPITDRDLGLTYQTAPGSIAKVMSAMAGFKKIGPKAYNRGFDIQQYMTVEPPSAEPNVGNRPKNRNNGKTTFLENAIKYSSNCYFVMLVNEEDLYGQLSDVYWNTGVALGGKRPYFFSTEEYTPSNKERFNKTIRTFRTNGLRDYSKYMNRTPLSTIWNPNSRRDRMSSIQTYTGIAWGQSQLEASPLNMARVASIPANGGKLTPTRYVLTDKVQSPIDILDSKSASLLASAMGDEASKWSGRILPQFLDGRIGGKTGTPMRTIRGNNVMNDGWYICYIKSADGSRSYSVAVRLERLPNKTISTEAVKLVGSIVIPTMQDCGYID